MTLSKEEKKKHWKSIKTEILALSIAGYAGQALLAIRGFLVAAWLGPSLYGVWHVLKVFIYTAPFVSLGITSGMVREIPFNKGKNEESKNKKIHKTTFTFGLLTSSFLGLAIIIASFFFWKGFHRTELQLAAVAFIGFNFISYSRNQLKAENQMIFLSQFNFGYAFLNTFLGLPLLYFYSLKGLILGLILSEAIIILLFWLRKRLYFLLGIDKKNLVSLLKIGFPLMILTLAQYLMLRLDSVMVFSFLGKESAGFYGLAAFLIVLTQYIPDSIATVLMPKIMHQFGKTNDRKDVEKYFIRPIRILSLVTPLLLGLLFINLKFPIHYFLPKYIPAIQTIQVLILSLYFTSIMPVPLNILAAFNKQVQASVLLIALLFLGVLFDVIAIKLGYGILGVGVATGITFFIVSSVFLSYALLTFGNHLREILWRLLKIYTPFLLMVILLWLFRFIPLPTSNLFFQAMLKTILYCFAFSPFLLTIKRNFKAH